jgi:hypothetical protein
MPRPPTAACAAVLPIVVFEMAFSVLSTPRKPAGNRGGLPGLAGSRQAPRSLASPRSVTVPRLTRMPRRDAKIGSASRSRNCPLGQGQGRRLIRSPVVVQLSLHLSSGSGSPAQSFQAPFGGDARARFSQRAPRRATSLRAPACSLSRPWRDASYPKRRREQAA